jgi:hypothetical protein
MHIFEIIKPGTWIEGITRDAAWEIGGQLDHLITQFYDANVALNHFEQVQNTTRFEHSMEKWDQDRQRRSDIRSQIELEMQGDFWELQKTIDFETEARFLRERWNRGEVPERFNHALPFIYARAFLYALDGFDRFLSLLSKDEVNGVPPVLLELHDEFNRCFPDLREVRNSAHHSESRSRGLDKNRKPLKLKPIDNELIKAPGGVLVMNSLNGSKYGATMTDGHYGEVDVSAKSMRDLQRILQSVLESFTWTGTKQLLPSK